MKIYLFFILIFILSLFLESTVIPFPFIFVFSVTLFFMRKDLFSNILILCFAIMIDSFLMRNIGLTSLFLFSLFGVSLILEKLFAVQGKWLFMILFLVLLDLYRREVAYPFSPVLFTSLVIGLLVLVYFEHQKNLKKQIL